MLMMDAGRMAVEHTWPFGGAREGKRANLLDRYRNRKQAEGQIGRFDGEPFFRMFNSFRRSQNRMRSMQGEQFGFLLQHYSNMFIRRRLTTSPRRITKARHAERERELKE